MADPIPRHAHGVAALALVFTLGFLCAGTPGLGGWGKRPFSSQKSRADIVKYVPSALAPVAVGAAWFRQHVHAPMAAKLLPIQRLFRIRQAWHLYGGGPPKMKWMEAFVDGELVYRTGDSDHAWATDQLDHRRVRPILKRVVEKPGALNWRLLGGRLVKRAQVDFPGAQEVRLLSVWQLRDGSPSFIHHGRVAQAPEWSMASLGEGGAVVPDAVPDAPAQEQP